MLKNFNARSFKPNLGATLMAWLNELYAFATHHADNACSWNLTL